MEPQEMNYQEQPTSDVTLHEDSPSKLTWIWWLIGIFIILGLAWFVFGKKLQNQNVLNNLSGEPASQIVDYSDEQSYDEHGLPVNGPLATIDDASIEIAESFPVQVSLVTKGFLQNGCTYLNEASQNRKGNTFYVNLTTRTEGETCTQALVPFSRSTSLEVNGLPAGTYQISVNGQELSFELPQTNKLDYNIETSK